MAVSNTPQETPAPVQGQEELKVVVSFKGDRATIGVQGKNTDPVMERVPIINQEDALEEVFAAAIDLVARARERWATSPRNPAYQGPPPPPQAPRTPDTAPRDTAVARSAGRRAAPQGGMNRML